MSRRSTPLMAGLFVAAVFALTSGPAHAARYGSPTVIGPVPANGVLRVYLKAMSASGPHRLNFLNTRTGAFSTVSTPGGSYGLVGLATTLPVATGDSVQIEMLNDNTGGSMAIGYEDPVAAWQCNGGDDFGDLYGMAAAAGAPILAVQCWEDWTDADYNDVALIVSYEPATVSTNTFTPTATQTATWTPTATRTPTATATATATWTPTATATATPVRADLSVTVSNSESSVTAGTATIYAVVVRNDGPNPVTAAPVSASFSAAFGSLTWTCSATDGMCGAGSGSGSVNTTVSLSAGGSATFTVSGLVRHDATGVASASASVSTAGGVQESDPADNSSSDSDPIRVITDLSLTKGNGTGVVIPGTETTYTLVVANGGPSRAVDVPVTDIFPAQLEAVTWTCAASAGACGSDAGAGDIHALVSLDPGGTASFTAVARVRADATGTVSNLAALGVPSGAIDPTPEDETATDVDVLEPRADLALSLANGVDAIVPGTDTSYTVTVTNRGPSTVAGARVSVPFAAQLSNISWSCAATGGACGLAGGDGDVETTLTLSPGGSATFTATGRVAAGATDALTQAATVGVPAGVLDPDTANNRAVDTDALAPVADIAISKSVSPSSLAPGQWVTYTITVLNAGPSDAPTVTVTDYLAPDLQNATWTCAASAGSTCAKASGSGDIQTTVDLKAGGMATFTLRTRVRSTAAGVVNNSATADVGGSVLDPNPGDNHSGDIPVVLFPEAGLAIVKTNGVNAITPGLPVTYTITVHNGGPSAARGVAVLDMVPAQLAGATWTCAATVGSRCAIDAGSRDISTTVDLLDDGQAVFNLVGRVPADAHLSGVGMTNTVSLTAPAGVTVPPGFQSSTDADPFAPQADLAVTLSSDAVPGAPPGTEIRQRLSLANLGPSVAVNARLVYRLPASAEVLAPPAGCTLAGDRITCDLGQLGTGDRRDVFIRLRHLEEGTLTTSAQASSDVPDPAEGNNSASHTSFTGPRPTTVPTHTPTATPPTPTATAQPGQRASETPPATTTPTRTPMPTTTASATVSPTPTREPSRTPVQMRVTPVRLTPTPPAPSARNGWLWLYGLATTILSGLILGTTALLRDPRPWALRRLTALAAWQLQRKQDFEDHTP